MSCVAAVVHARRIRTRSKPSCSGCGESIAHEQGGGARRTAPEHDGESRHWRRIGSLAGASACEAGAGKAQWAAAVDGEGARLVVGRRD
jgi:hypothetical protein